MNYKMTVTLVNPDPEHDDRPASVTIKYTVSFAHDPEQYGNGYSMAMKPETGCTEYYDVRYDTRFKASDKMGYLYQYARDRWTGEQGSLRLDGITLESI